jgi:hypothetical protein
MLDACECFAELAKDSDAAKYAATSTDCGKRSGRADARRRDVGRSEKRVGGTRARA